MHSLHTCIHEEEIKRGGGNQDLLENVSENNIYIVLNIVLVLLDHSDPIGGKTKNRAKFGAAASCSAGLCKERQDANTLSVSTARPQHQRRR